MGFFVFDPKGYRLPFHPESRWREISASAEAVSHTELPFKQQKRKEMEKRVKDVLEKAPRERPSWLHPPKRGGMIVAAQVMKRPVYTLQPTTTVGAAWEIFCDKRFRHIPIVTEEAGLVGILSDRTLLSALMEGEEIHNHQISEIMTSPVLTAIPSTDIKQIAKAFINERIGGMPIVDDQGELVGMITRSDILRTITNLDIDRIDFRV